jgi:hypothetical protein
MPTLVAENEHYLLLSDGQRYTVVERRAGKLYSLLSGDRRGNDLSEEAFAELIRQSGSRSSGELASEQLPFAVMSTDPGRRHAPCARACRTAVDDAQINR